MPSAVTKRPLPQWVRLDGVPVRLVRMRGTTAVLKRYFTGGDGKPRFYYYETQRKQLRTKLGRFV